MKKIEEMRNECFIFKCVCGAKQEDGRIEFGLCEFPYYNERFNGIMCEKCQQPVFLGHIDPSKLKRGSEEERAFFNQHVQLRSDKMFLSELENLRKLVKEDADTVPEGDEPVPL